MMKQPIFVKLDEYNEIMKMVSSIKDKVEDAKRALGSINDLKHKEDAELESWKANLTEIEKRIEDITQTFTEPSQPGD